MALALTLFASLIAGESVVVRLHIMTTLDIETIRLEMSCAVRDGAHLHDSSFDELFEVSTGQYRTPS